MLVSNHSFFLPFITFLISPGSYGTFFALFRRILDTDIIFLFVWFVSGTSASDVSIGPVSQIWAVMAKWVAWISVCTLFIRKLYHKFGKQWHRKYLRMCMQDKPFHFLTQRGVMAFALENSTTKKNL